MKILLYFQFSTFNSLRHFLLSIFFSFSFVFFFFSCRSLPPEQRLQANIRTEEATSVDRSERSRTTWNESLLEAFSLKTDETTTVGTMIIRYDTSLPVDSLTGLHPVREIVQSAVVKRKESALSDGIEQEKKGEQVSGTDTQLRKETTQQQIIDQKQEPGKDPYRWRYLAIITGIVALSFGVPAIIRYIKN